MFSLVKNPILRPHQIPILKLFFSTPLTGNFFLTGGTALSAFYLAHRESKDFDFFSIEPFDFRLIDELLKEIAKKTRADFSIKVAAHSYKEYYLENPKAGWIQRIDIVREQPKRFGEIKHIDGINIDSLENIGSNKILTLFSRLEPKDYIDFYMIIQKSKWTFEQLFEMAKKKDTGLFEFYFANSIASIGKIEIWPEMKIKFDRKKMISYYRKLTRDLLVKLKPDA